MATGTGKTMLGQLEKYIVTNIVLTCITYVLKVIIYNECLYYNILKQMLDCNCSWNPLQIVLVPVSTRPHYEQL